MVVIVVVVFVVERKRERELSLRNRLVVTSFGRPHLLRQRLRLDAVAFDVATTAKRGEAARRKVAREELLALETDARRACRRTERLAARHAARRSMEATITLKVFSVLTARHRAADDAHARSRLARDRSRRRRESR